ncbi:MAG: FHA domain-containing protein [Nitrospinae bacterium]|nr:FHA domain-containing protein [Nitrospinota bacterium]
MSNTAPPDNDKTQVYLPSDENREGNSGNQEKDTQPEEDSLPLDNGKTVVASHSVGPEGEKDEDSVLEEDEKTRIYTEEERPRGDGKTALGHLKIYKDGRRVQTAPLYYDGMIRVGRATNNEVVLEDPNISRKHLTIFYKEDGFFIEDLSKGGTILNRKKIPHKQPVKLSNGDKITLSGFQLAISLDGHGTGSFSEDFIEKIKDNKFIAILGLAILAGLAWAFYFLASGPGKEAPTGAQSVARKSQANKGLEFEGSIGSISRNYFIIEVDAAASDISKLEEGMAVKAKTSLTGDEGLPAKIETIAKEGFQKAGKTYFKTEVKVVAMDDAIKSIKIGSQAKVELSW